MRSNLSESGTETADDQAPDVVDNGFTGLSLLRLAQLAMDQFLFEPIDTNPRRHWTLARDASEALALARPLLEKAVTTLAENAPSET